MPIISSLYIMEGNVPCIVPTVSEKIAKDGLSFLSALQLKRKLVAGDCFT